MRIYGADSGYPERYTRLVTAAVPGHFRIASKLIELWNTHFLVLFNPKVPLVQIRGLCTYALTGIVKPIYHRLVLLSGLRRKHTTRFVLCSTRFLSVLQGGGDTLPTKRLSWRSKPVFWTAVGFSGMDWRLGLKMQGKCGKVGVYLESYILPCLIAP